MYQSIVYGGSSLTRRDPETLQLVPHAAEHWTVSADRRTYTFRLRDLAWSDGRPMTAADFVWTYQQAIKPENRYFRVDALAPIASYRALDPRTLEVTLTDDLVVGLETADYITPLPRHVWERYDWNDPAENPEIMHPTVGNGAWILDEWRLNERTTFVANDHFVLGKPKIGSLVVRIFGGRDVPYDALAAGDVDAVALPPIEDREPPDHIDVHRYYAAASGYTFIGFNMRRPVVQDRHVRAAIAYATDRDAIIDVLLSGRARPVYAHYTQSSWAYNPDVQRYDFSPEQAREQFRQAGYSPDSDGRLVKDGRPLTLTLALNTPNFVREGIAYLLGEQLDELGVRLDVREFEFQRYLDFIKTPPYDYDLYILGWTGTIDPHWANQIWSEETIPALNTGGYVNREVERLFARGAREFDMEQRRQIYGQIQRLLADELPYVFLFEGESAYGVNRRIGGVVPTRLGVTYNLHEWFIRE
jgi:peptide/nickel transport system substrate-binding protein